MPALLLEVARLHQCAGEIQILDVGRFPLARLGGKSVVDRKSRHARFIENGGVEAEPGAENDAIIGVFRLSTVRSPEGHFDDELSISTLDAIDSAVHHAISGLQKIRVQKIIIDRSEMPQIMALPRQF